MNNLFHYLLIFMVFLLLGGCGQKGPLYLPENQSDNREAAAAARAEKTDRALEPAAPLEEEQP